MLTGLWRILDEAWGVQDGPDDDATRPVDGGDGADGGDSSSSSGSPPPSPRSGPGPSSAPLAIEDQPASLEVDAESEQKDLEVVAESEEEDLEVDAESEEEEVAAGAESSPANPSLSHETSGGHDLEHPSGPESSSSPMGGTSSIDDAKSKILAKVEALKTGAFK